MHLSQGTNIPLHSYMVKPHCMEPDSIFLHIFWRILSFWFIKTADSNINHQGMCVQFSFSEQPDSYYAWCTCSELNTTTPNSMESCCLSISPQSRAVKVCYYQLLTAVGLMSFCSPVSFSLGEEAFEYHLCSIWWCTIPLWCIEFHNQWAGYGTWRNQ